MKAYVSAFAVLVLTGFAASAQAQVYKCVDSNGKVVYLQSPCPSGQTSSVLRTPGAPPAPAAAAASDGKPAAKTGSVAEQEADYRKRQKEREDAQKKANEQTAQASELRENCERAKATVAQIGAGGRFTGINAQGERYYLDDAQIAAEKARADAAVAANCK